MHRAPRIEFLLDGRPVEPTCMSFGGGAEEPGPGGVAFIDHFAIVLDDKQARYDLLSSPNTEGLLRERLSDGEERIVSIWVGGVDVESTEGEDEDDTVEVSVNPFETLSDSELGALRGVTLTEWEDSLASQLDRVPLDQACIWAQLSRGVGRPKGLPPLPRSLRYLRFDVGSSHGFEDFSRLEEFEPRVEFGASLGAW